MALNSRTACLAALAVLSLSILLPNGPAEAISDPRDRGPMQSALNDLLSFAEPGRSVRYENPVTGNGGAITALASIGRGTAECWDYQRTFEQAGRVMTVDGTACELEQGLWQIEHESAARPTPDPVPSTQESVQPMPAPQSVAPQPVTPQSVTPQSGTPPVAESAASKRERVREIQQLLTDLGYRPGPVDGLFGAKTEAAILAYQGDAGVPRTGKASEELLAMLRSNRSAALPPPGAVSQPAPAPAAAPAPAPTPLPAPGAEATQPTAPSVGTQGIVVPPPPPPPPVPQ